VTFVDWFPPIRLHMPSTGLGWHCYSVVPTTCGQLNEVSLVSTFEKLKRYCVSGTLQARVQMKSVKDELTYFFQLLVTSSSCFDM
jgi:hypothetical protein